MKSLLSLLLLVPLKTMAIPVIKIPPVPRPVPPPLECATAPYENLEVDTAGKFKTIQQANDFARSKNICKVQIRLFPGVFNETVNIERPTQLIANGRAVLKGSIVNLGGYELNINNLEIFEAKPVAIVQEAGHIEIKNTKILSTGSIPGLAESGVGILLKNVRGSIENTIINLSQKQALQVSGPNSLIKAKGLRVENTSYDRERALKIAPNDPESFHLLGALEVSDGAKVEISNSEFARNSLISIIVLKAATLNMFQVRVSNTLAFDGPRNSYLGGTALLLNSESKVRAERSVISDGLIGIISSASYLTYKDSSISGVEFGFGVAAENPEFSTYKCTIDQGASVQASDRQFVVLDGGAVSLCHSNPSVCAIPCP